MEMKGLSPGVGTGINGLLLLLYALNLFWFTRILQVFTSGKVNKPPSSSKQRQAQVEREAKVGRVCVWGALGHVGRGTAFVPRESYGQRGR